jgi:Type II secretion system (T2SS), protein E, N-terminal domain
MSRVRIGEMLVAQGAIDQHQLASALAHQRRWGGRIGRAFVSLGFLDEPRLLSALGAQMGVPFVEIGDRVIPSDVLALIPAKLIRARRVLPLSRFGPGRNAPIFVALADPKDLTVLDEVSFATGRPVKPMIAAEDDLDRAIAHHLDGKVPTTSRGFATRRDAIELPEDTNPLSVLRRGGHGDPTLN